MFAPEGYVAFTALKDEIRRTVSRFRERVLRDYSLDKHHHYLLGYSDPPSGKENALMAKAELIVDLFEVGLFDDCLRGGPHPIFIASSDGTVMRITDFMLIADWNLNMVTFFYPIDVDESQSHAIDFINKQLDWIAGKGDSSGVRTDDLYLAFDVFSGCLRTDADTLKRRGPITVLLDAETMSSFHSAAGQFDGWAVCLREADCKSLVEKLSCYSPPTLDEMVDAMSIKNGNDSGPDLSNSIKPSITNLRYRRHNAALQFYRDYKDRKISISAAAREIGVDKNTLSAGLKEIGPDGEVLGENRGD